MTAPASTGLRAGRWSVQPATGRAAFAVRDVLRRTVRGTLPLTSACVEVDARGVPVTVRAELDLAGVSTGHPRRDRDLLGPPFFDVQASPRLAFTGGPAAPRADGRWRLPGTLVMKGAQCPVELAVEVAPQGRAHRVRATTTLDRRELGITVPALLVGRAVEVVVEVDLLPPDGPA